MKEQNPTELRASVGLVAVAIVLLIVGCGLVLGPRAAGLALLVLGASLGLVGLVNVVIELRPRRGK